MLIAQITDLHIRPTGRLAYGRAVHQAMAVGIGALPILSLTEPAILRYEGLKALKLNVGKRDLCIAAITLENAGILITRNFRDFQRIPNLRLENWSV